MVEYFIVHSMFSNGNRTDIKAGNNCDKTMTISRKNNKKIYHKVNISFNIQNNCKVTLLRSY